MEQIRRYKKEIGIAVVVIIILSIISSFFSGSKKDESTALTGDGPEVASTGDGPEVASTGDGPEVASTGGGLQAASMSREDMERTVVGVKFGGSASIDPSKLAEVQLMASKLSFNNLDINEDNRISADEIPDGDLKDELFGYDLDKDGVLILSEYHEFFLDRQSKKKGKGVVTRSDNLSVSLM
jgi:hypothetical protein